MFRCDLRQLRWGVASKYTYADNYGFMYGGGYDNLPWMNLITLFFTKRSVWKELKTCCNVNKAWLNIMGVSVTAQVINSVIVT